MEGIHAVYLTLSALESSQGQHLQREQGSLLDKMLRPMSASASNLAKFTKLHQRLSLHAKRAKASSSSLDNEECVAKDLLLSLQSSHSIIMSLLHVKEKLAL
eukprot:4052324-Amphidinium_carterae.1